MPPAWLTPITPVQISDHVWQLGTAGITTLLFKTEAGAVLIDGGMPRQAAPVILDHLKQIGVAPSDVKLLLHSHAHADHVGSTAALQRATGAVVVSNAESAVLLARGGYNDLHYGDSIVFPPVTATRLLQDREVVQLDPCACRCGSRPATPRQHELDLDRHARRQASPAWRWWTAHPARLPPAAKRHLPAHRRRVPARPRPPSARCPCDVLITPHPDISGWQFDKPGNPHPEP